MSNVKIKANASGTADFTIQAPATDSALTLTLPSVSGEVLTVNGDGSQLTGINFDTSVLENNIALLGFKMAVNENLTLYNLQNTVIDEFNDLSGIDEAGSPDVTSIATDVVKFGVLPAATNAHQDPITNGLTLGETYTYYGAGSIWDDGTVTTDNFSYGDSTATITFDIPREITGLRAYGGFYGASNYWGYDGTEQIILQYSDDNSTWTNAATTGTLSQGATSPMPWNPSLSGNGEHKYWRVYHDLITSSRSYMRYIQIDVAAKGTVGAQVLKSNAMTAVSTPDTARVVLFQEELDSITYNTDLVVEVSRDGGTTWTASTNLANAGNYQTDRKIVAGTVDLSSQPSGTSIKYRITANSVDLNLYGVAVSWS